MKHVVDVVKYALALVLAAGLVTLMLPAAVQASGQLVTIVDRDSAAQTQVDGGRLRVGDGNGAMTVDGVVGTSYRGRTPYRDFCNIRAEEGHANDICTFRAVPADQVLVITQISAGVRLPSDQAPYSLMVDLDGGLFDTAAIRVGYDQSTTDGAERSVAYSHHTELAVMGGGQYSMSAGVSRTDTAGVMSGTVAINGYLTTP